MVEEQKPLKCYYSNYPCEHYSKFRKNLCPIYLRFADLMMPE